MMMNIMDDYILSYTGISKGDKIKLQAGWAGKPSKEEREQASKQANPSEALSHVRPWRLESGQGCIRAG